MIKVKNRWIGTSRVVFPNNLLVKMSWRRVEGVLMKSRRRFNKTSWKPPEDIRHKTKVNISILIKTSWRRRWKVSSIRPHQDECLLGLVSFHQKIFNSPIFLFHGHAWAFDQIFGLFLKTLILLYVKQKFCLLKLLQLLRGCSQPQR